MRKSRFLLSLTVALILAFGLLSQFEMTADAATTTASGYCGAEGVEESVKWSLNSGMLTISGSGAIADYRKVIDNQDVIYSRPWTKYKNKITSLVIEDGITEIGTEAFASLPKLKTVEFPASLEYIGNFAFFECSSLGDFTLPENLKKLGQQCFATCNSITRLEIPDNVTFLDSGICENCTSLTSVYIGGSQYVSSYVHSYGQFRGCTALKKIEVSEDNAGLSVKDNVLYTKDGKTLVQYPSGRTEKTFKIPEGVECISQFSIAHTKLTGIELPSTIKTIDVCAFEGSSKLLYIKNNSENVIDLSDTMIDYLYDGGDKSVQRIGANQTLYTKKKTLSLSNSVYVYNGKTRTPKVTVKNGAGETLAKDVDYTVSYPTQRKNVGTYTVSVKFKGEYGGTKKVTFKINPKSPQLKKVTPGSKKITISWAKMTTQVSGYQIRYSEKSSMKNAKSITISKNGQTSYVKKNLKSGKKYYVQIRTYKKVDGKKYYSSWSTKKYAKVKK